LKRTDSNQPDYAELKKAIAALEEVMTLVAEIIFFVARVMTIEDFICSSR